MDYPVCKICDAKHSLRDPHQFKSVVNQVTTTPKLLAKAPKFDRVAYQREYMRALREAQRKLRLAAPPKPCVVCGKPARSKSAKFCEECHAGCKPASVEYAVMRAIRTGQLKPVRECVCVDCGVPAEHYDHRDYNKPTEVEPVCRKCNVKRGHAIRYGKNADGSPISAST